MVMQAFMVRFLTACALVVALLPVVEVRPVQASGVVINCSSDVQFGSRLDGGGVVTFNCGTALINLDSTKIISANTTIDGGGKITLSGQNTHLLFVVNDGVSLTLRNIVLTGGFHSGDGGAIYNNGTLILENSTIRNSRAGLSGGAIVSYGPLTISNSLLEGNQALNGGALYPRFAGAQTRIINSVLRNNRATDTTNGWGGAILAWDGAPVTIENSDLYANSALLGGAIYNFPNSSVTHDGGTLYTNSARLGGGLYNGGTATLTNVTLSGNPATRDGGGIYNFGGTTTLTNVTLSGNPAARDGGGIYNFGGTATLTNVTLSGNSATRDGGGIYNDSSTAILTNVTLNGNSATRDGGGIYHYSVGPTLSIKNSILANSPSGQNCFAPQLKPTSNDFNLSSDNSCFLNQPGDRHNQNPLLGLLADYGGPTMTHMPQSGSPAIDFVAGGCPPPTKDQRGANRPIDGDDNGSARCDAGAVEYGTAVMVVYLPLVLK